MDPDRIASGFDAKIGLRISRAISSRLQQTPLPTTHPRENESVIPLVLNRALSIPGYAN